MLVSVFTIAAMTLASPQESHPAEHRRFQGIPSLAVSASGRRLWATWYAGPSPRENADNYAVLATSVDGGATWKEVLVADPDGPGGRRAFDPEVWTAPDGKLRWTWTDGVGYSVEEAWLTSVTLDAENEPSGPYPVPRRIAPGVMMCKPIVLRSGEWLYPVAQWYREPSSVFYATCDGIGFERRGGVTLPKDERTFDEEMAVQRVNGEVVAFVRTLSGTLMSCSSDGGRNWSVPSRPTEFDNCSTRRFVRRLANGHWLLVKNGRTPLARAARCDLTAFVSHDEGRTWKGGLLLDARDGATYPDGDQQPDGTLQVVYDRDRTGDRDILLATFREEDVLAGAIVSSVGRLRHCISCWPDVRARQAALDDPAKLADFPPNVWTGGEIPPRYRTAAPVFSSADGSVTTSVGRVWGVRMSKGNVFVASSDDRGKTWESPGVVVEGAFDGASARSGLSDPRLTLGTDGRLTLSVVRQVEGVEGKTSWSIHTGDSEAKDPSWTAINKEKTR